MSDPKLPPGSNFCKCPSCGEYFSNANNFDMHRRGSPTARVCVPPGKLVTEKGKRRLRLNAKGYWVRAEGVFTGGVKKR